MLALVHLFVILEGCEEGEEEEESIKSRRRRRPKTTATRTKLRQCYTVRKFESMTCAYSTHHNYTPSPTPSHITSHRRPLPPLLLPPIPINYIQPGQLLITNPLQTHHIHAHKFAQMLPLPSPKSPHSANFTEQMLHFFVAEAVIREVLLASGGESEF